MFFILSKTLNFLVMPLTVISICFVAAAVMRNAKWKKRMFWSGLALLLFFSNEFIANKLMRAWELETPALSSVRRYKVGIVLTGATITGLSPGDRVYFHRGADRVTHTIQLYKLGLIDTILISGGSGLILEKPETEADKFRTVMTMAGVPDSVIIIENTSRNTHESAVEVKKILDSLGFVQDDCLLITSAFHMRRSLACFRKEGIDLEPFTTDFYGHPGKNYPDSFLVPKVEALIIWNKLVKEWTGLVAYKIAGYV